MVEISPAMGTPFQQWLGLRWTVTDAGLTVDMDLREDLCGPARTLEGGVTCTLADVAGASVAAFTTNKLVATEHLSISFLAPGRIGPISAAATLLRAGANDAVSEVRVVDHGKDDRLMAVALVTVRFIGNLPTR